MATKTSTARVHPAKLHPDPKSMQALLRYLRAIGRHDLDGADGIREMAHKHHRAILDSSKLPFGVDKRWAARKQRRALVMLANAHELAAHQAGVARATTLGTFGQASGGSGGGFDPNM
jgi:hypothetical protein